MSPRTLFRSSSLAAAILLTACGGGGDDGPLAEAQAADAAEQRSATTLALTLPPLVIPSGQETVTCANRSIGAVSLDTVFVADGATCQMQGTRLRGSIRVGSRSVLQATGVRVTGDVQAEGSRNVTLRGNSTVGGSVQIKQGGAATVAASRITGDLQLDAMSGALRATGNRIGGSLQAVGNRGGVSLVNNTMNGNLQCKENRPAPTGSGNVAALKEDQCRRL